SPRTRRGARARARAAAAATTAATEHLHVVTDDLGRIALVALLVLPLARAQAALDVHLRALAQVLGRNLRQAPEECDPVPLGALLLLPALLGAPALARGDAQVRDRGARGHGARLRVRAQIADENDLVDAAGHVDVLRECVGAAARAPAGPRRDGGCILVEPAARCDGAFAARTPQKGQCRAA